MPSESTVCTACGRLTRASAHVNLCVMCGGTLAPAQLGTVDQYVRSAANVAAVPFTPDAAGERKHITVLFADIASSTELISDLDPEDAYELMQPTIRIMMDAVHRYGGTVNQVLGDGIMALFGAPLAQEKHATMACLASLLMQANVERSSDKVMPGLERPVRIRVGMNSGEVVVRAIENDLEIDYRAIGHDVHLAARMQTGGAPGEIIVTRETACLAGDLIITEEVPGISDKDGGKLPRAYRVVNTRIVDDVDGSVSTRILSEMVGREAELRTLGDARDKAAKYDSQAVGITGAPGIGKSRLLYEFSRGLPSDDCRLLWCTATLQDSSAPLRPIVRLMQKVLGVSSNNDECAVRDAVARRLSGLGLPSEFAYPALLELFGFEADDNGWEGLDPPDRRRHTIDTVLTVLIGECLEQPLVVLFEDLQFADSETCEVVGKIVENLRSLPFLLLLSYRPEFQHDWVHEPHFSEVRLEPLRRKDALRLLEGHVGTDDSLEALKEMLVERANGIPFYLEECVLNLIECGQLVGTPGHYLLNGTLDEVVAPRSIHDVIAARIDHLPPLDKQVLVAAAVVGKDVSNGLLREIVSLPQEDYVACVERPSSRGIPRRSTTVP